MANVNIKFNGKEFLLSCDDGQEDHLEELSNHLNEKFEGLKNDLGNIGENKLLLITSIKIMDEYFETKKKITEKKNELENLKVDKEKEINCLLNNHEDLKSEIDKTKLNYEKILDEATSEIDKFIEKVNQDNSVQ